MSWGIAHAFWTAAKGSTNGAISDEAITDVVLGIMWVAGTTGVPCTSDWCSDWAFRRFFGVAPVIDPVPALWGSLLTAPKFLMIWEARLALLGYSFYRSYPYYSWRFCQGGVGRFRRRWQIWLLQQLQTLTFRFSLLRWALKRWLPVSLLKKHLLSRH